MKLTIITLLLLVTFVSQAQKVEKCNREMQYRSYTPPENYVGGGMLIGTFITVSLSDPYVNKQQRDVIAFTCMTTTLVTYLIIRKIRLKHK